MGVLGFWQDLTNWQVGQRTRKAACSASACACAYSRPPLNASSPSVAAAFSSSLPTGPASRGDGGLICQSSNVTIIFFGRRLEQLLANGACGVWQFGDLYGEAW